MGKSYKKHQKVYKMKGCSKKHLGGSADINLAYPSNNVPTIKNPFFAYNGKGGMPATYMPENINAANKTIPNTGPIAKGYNFLNPQGAQHGGNCGAMCAPNMNGGSKHRTGCKCSQCKNKMKGGNSGLPYPNGLVGSAWTSSPNTWPGVDGIQGNSNYLPLNEYKTDPQTALIATGANKPFLIGGKRKNKTMKQRGGTLSNFFTQDLINLGRQFQFGLGSAYNALTGYSAPVNPLPWKDQIPSAANISTIKSSMI